MITYHKTTEEEKYAIAEWRYIGDYAIYNGAPYEEQKKRGVGFANPRNNFYSFYDGAVLIGFINLYEEKTGLSLASAQIRTAAAAVWSAHDQNGLRNLSVAVSGKAAVSGGQDMEYPRRPVL